MSHLNDILVHEQKERRIDEMMGIAFVALVVFILAVWILYL